MKKLKKIMALMLVSVFVIAVYGCGDETLTGTWTGKMANETSVTYSFQDDGTGTYTEGEIALSTSYKTEGNQLTLSIEFLGQTREETYTYKIKGNTMTLTSSDEETITLTKNK